MIEWQGGDMPVAGDTVVAFRLRAGGEGECHAGRLHWRHRQQITDIVAYRVVGSSADDRQEGGDHYRKMPVQPWEAMAAWMSPEQFNGFLRGNAIKYLARYDAKGGREDLRKARHYLDKLIEVMGDDDQN